MCQDLECRMRLGRRALQSKAYLETDYLLFRGEDRVKILLKDLRNVTAADGVLKLDFEGGPAALELGAAAEKWVRRILHPPTLADKLGLKPGLTVRLSGEFPADFLEALQNHDMAAPRAKADLIFLLA